MPQATLDIADFGPGLFHHAGKGMSQGVDFAHPEMFIADISDRLNTDSLAPRNRGQADPDWRVGCQSGKICPVDGMQVIEQGGRDFFGKMGDALTRGSIRRVHSVLNLCQPRAQSAIAMCWAGSSATSIAGLAISRRFFEPYGLGLMLLSDEVL